MALQIKSPVDFNTFASLQFVLGEVGNAVAGAMNYDSTGAGGNDVYPVPTDGCLVWHDNTGAAHSVPPLYNRDLLDPSGSGVVLAEFGVVKALEFEGDLTGTASTAYNLSSAVQVSVTGKATAAATNLQGATTPTVVLNVTALSVAPGEIALTTGNFLVGVGGVASDVAKSTIPISGFAAATAPVNFGGKLLQNVATPSAGTDGANKDYVDNLVSGTSAPSDPARVATTAALAAYTPAGSPAVLTANANALLQIDGINLSDGDSVLVKDESGANEKYNGIYTVTDAGANDPGGSPFILTRRDDANTSVEINTGDTYFVREGTDNGGTTWSLQTAPPITLGTTALHFVQIAGQAAYQAGKGLVAVGNIFHFAQSTDYTQYAVPYALDVDEIGFTAAGSAGQVLRIPSIGGAPAFGALDLDSANSVTGTLAVANGGTNIASYATGDILYASGATTLAKLAAVAAGKVLISGTTPSWDQVDLTTQVKNVLPIASGGTNRASFTVNGVVLGNGTSALNVTAAGTSGQFLQANPSGLPRFVSMTGDATMTTTIGPDSAVLVIANKAVSFGKIQDVSTGIVVGRLTAGSGSVEQITTATLATALMATGNINPSTTLTGDVTGTGTGSIATTIASLAFSKLQQGSALSVLGVAGTSAASVASIAAGVSPSNKVLRVKSDGTALEFGSINLASSNAVTGILPTTNGGTGSNLGYTFPGTAGAIALVRTYELTAGAAQYTITHGLSTSLLAPTVRDSTGAIVLVDIVIDPTTAVVTFGGVTSSSHTLILVGSDTV